MTICEFGPRDGEVIDIPDGSRAYRFPVMTGTPTFRFIEPQYEQRRVDDTIRMRPNPRFNQPFHDPDPMRIDTIIYVVCEYRDPSLHATRFALVSPDFLAASLR